MSLCNAKRNRGDGYVYTCTREKGHCSQHMMHGTGFRWRGERRVMSVRERLDLCRKINPITGCWEWTKFRDTNGYGHIWNGTRHALVHVTAWIIYVGPVPEGKNILHKCDNPPCFNPDHIYPGTQKDNVRDMIERRRGLVGEHNGSSILTEQQVLNIREAAKTKTGYRIAKESGINCNTVYDILRGDTWSWL